MAMTWTSLVAPKGTAGSLANWVGYAKLDTQTILDEAQSLIFQMLRVREMRTELLFNVRKNTSQYTLPQNFLDPATALISTKTGIECTHRTVDEVMRQRVYENQTGVLGNDALTKLSGAGYFLVALPAHGITGGSDFTVSGATPVAGVDPNYAACKVINYYGDDTLAIWSPTFGQTSTATGGGPNMTYEANRLITSYPTCWATIGDSNYPYLVFDCAFEDQDQFRMIYYGSPDLLSSDNPSNWLSRRYPNLLRKACQTAAADFMKDDAEYTKGLAALSGLITTIAAADDMSYRGSHLETETP